MGKIDPNGNNKAENMIALASYHARHTTGWNSKAEGYINDAESLLADCKYDAACAAALRSLEYSIGILHADYVLAKAAVSFSDVPQYPEDEPVKVADAEPSAPGFKIPTPPISFPSGPIGIDLPRGAVVEQPIEDAPTSKIVKSIDLTGSASVILIVAANHTDEAEVAKANAHLDLRKRTALYHDIHVRAMMLTVYGNDPRLVYVCFAGKRSVSIPFPVFEHADRFADFYALSIIDGERDGMVAPTDQEYADFIASRVVNGA